MGSGREYSRHQQGIIKRYYEHLDTIALQRLGEIVSELYLADTDKKRDQLWKRAEKSLSKVGEKDAEVRRVLKERDVEGLAMLVGGKWGG